MKDQQRIEEAQITGIIPESGDGTGPPTFSNKNDYNTMNSKYYANKFDSLGEMDRISGNTN